MPRATRYALNLPVRFRPDGERAWSYGMSLNISHTGLLFEAARDFDPGQSLEIEVVLPGDDQGSARVVTRGVIRRAAAGTRDGEGAMAAALDDYELLRTPKHANG